MRIVTCLSRHGTERYPHAIPDLQGWFEQQLPDVQHDLVIVDNALPPSHEEPLDSGRVLLGSSNTHWEFSAWDRAIEFLGDRLHEYDFLHLATSAFRSLYVDYLDRFNREMLTLVAGRRATVGHVDYYNEPVSLFGYSLQSWIRSSWMFLPVSEVRRLATFISIPSSAMLFSGDPRQPFRSDAPMSSNYQHYIVDWLTGPGTGQGVEWHSRFQLTSATLPYFEAKAHAILNEQMLSYRLQEQGCSLVDTIWLDTQRKLTTAGSLVNIPDWQRQITSRDSNPAPRSLVDGSMRSKITSRLMATLRRLYMRGLLAR